MTFLEESIQPENKIKAAGITNNIALNFPPILINAMREKDNKEAFSYPSAGEVSAYLDTQDNLHHEVNWSVIRMLPIEERHIDYLIGNVDIYSHLYGEEEFKEVLFYKLYTQVKRAAKNDDEKEGERVLALAKKHLPDEVLDLEYAYHKAMADWVQSISTFKKLINLRGGIKGNESTVNSFAWDVYLKCGNHAVITQAADWMRVVTQRKATYMYLDTYAALLLKSNNLMLGEKVARLAIAIGNSSGENVKSTVDMLSSYIERSY